MSTLACSLPSAGSAAAVIEGRPGAIPTACLHMGMRGALIATGIAGTDGVFQVLAPGTPRLGFGRSLALGFGAAAVIETYLLTWMWMHARPLRNDGCLLASYGRSAPR